MVRLDGDIVDAYIIIGQDSVGKSSLVRALTGIRNHDKRLMTRLVGPDFCLWAKDSSLLEAEVDPAAFVAEINGKGVNAVLLTLWPRSRKSKGTTYPDAATYIQVFVAHGWSIQPVVLLDRWGTAPSVTLSPGIGSSHFTNSSNAGFNTLAALVRTYWGWG